ncbi:MAG: lysophospholipid acyltransferase family protein [Antarcticimicrobium sp.]|uniref:lysophospholipid acyltransferase family protein n=1 Tax=Antarcticimicrobium sp. TaxID=2824147 RepID=UPI0026074BF2|nr:lysophospholipid acyltransferase family protein [Antarcticimicrobium sp.]MDF1718721.1 lysophospholipid acyltransferase family protein [Antarcticimicrobium sp.]
MPADPSTLSLADRAGYIASNLVLRGLIGVFRAIPYRWRVPAMGWLVSRAAPLFGVTRRIRSNLELARPDLSEAEVRRLCRAVPDNAGRTLIELYSGAPFIARARRAPIHGPGLAALEAARAAGRPVILITGHFGNYDTARANLIARGHEMGALYRRMANPYFNAHYVRTISNIGTPMFEQGRRGMTQMVRHLKQGGIIAIVGDLHAHGGLDLDFFGQPAVTSTVPAELALKYDAALIPVYAIRQPNGLDFEIVMPDEIPPGDAVAMTQQVNDGLEALVREHMEQWFWIHRRWKPYIGIEGHDNAGR